MNEKTDLLVPAGGMVRSDPQTPSPMRGKGFEISGVAPTDREQVNRTILALEKAGMTFEEVAKACESLGYEVRRVDGDGLLKNGEWQEEEYPTPVMDEYTTIAWQRRGEKVPINHQIASPVGDIDNKLVAVSRSLVSDQPESDQDIEVLEGVKVLMKDQSILVQDAAPQPIQIGGNNDLTNNPFLRPFEEKKAA